METKARTRGLAVGLTVGGLMGLIGQFIPEAQSWTPSLFVFVVGLTGLAETRSNP